MGEFFAFLLRHLYAAFVALVGAALVIFGIVQDGLDIRALGLPSWAFQLAGFLLFVGAVVHLLFGWDKKMQAIPEHPAEAEEKETPPLRTLSRARVTASTATYYKHNQAIIASGVAEMRAAILTAHKAFGMPVAEITDDYDGIQRARGYLDAILPYLQNGHIEEAAAAAQKFIE